jgi:hypothetical protein
MAPLAAGGVAFSGSDAVNTAGVVALDGDGDTLWEASGGPGRVTNVISGQGGNLLTTGGFWTWYVGDIGLGTQQAVVPLSTAGQWLGGMPGFPSSVTVTVSDGLVGDGSVVVELLPFGSG